MKVIAGRDRDVRDARAIIEKLRLRDPSQVLDILKKYIPRQHLTAKIQYLVGDLFE